MVQKLFFEMSAGNREAMVKTVNAVPADRWWYLNGFFDAPPNLVQAGIVEWNTGFSFGQHSCIHPNIIGRSHHDERGLRHSKQRNVCAVTAWRKYPGFVEFEEAGLNDELDFPFSEVRKVFAEYILLGYYGTFFVGWAPDGPPQASLHAVWEPHSQFGDQPDMMESVYNICIEADEGWEKQVDGMVEAIRSTNTREYIPCTN